jgi:hypothetical protein
MGGSGACWEPNRDLTSFHVSAIDSVLGVPNFCRARGRASTCVENKALAITAIPGDLVFKF